VNPDIKARWLAALRSGQYQQGQKYLKVNDRFCCLGVLCDLAVEDGVAEWGPSGYCHSEATARTDLDYDLVNNSNTSLPPAVQAWAGLDQADPIVTEVSSDDFYRFGRFNLSELNDDEGWDFFQIADVIERQL
jgi:hypothetical protein